MAPALCPYSICEASRRPALRPSRPPTFLLGSLSAAPSPAPVPVPALCLHSICEASRRSSLCPFHPFPFRPPPVLPSAGFALRSFFCLARLFFLLPHPDSVFKPDGHFRPAFFSPTVLLAAFQAPFFNTLLYTLYIIRSECRFRTPPGRFCFANLMQPPPFLSVFLSASPSAFSSAAPSARIFPACRTLHRASQLTFLLPAAPRIRPFSPVALPLLLFFTAHRALPPEFFPPAAFFTAPPARPFRILPHPSSALFHRSPLPNSGFSPLAPFLNSIFSPPAAPFSPPFPRKFAAPFGKVKALLRASPSELRIGPTPTSAPSSLPLRPQSFRLRFYGRNASCRFTIRSKLRQKNIQKNL